MRSYPKEPPGRSEEYLSYIRGLPCCVCGKSAEPHHLGTGGMGMKGSDFSAIPMCRKHHDEAQAYKKEFHKDSPFLWRCVADNLVRWADRNWSEGRL